MTPAEIIRTKREGGTLTQDALASFARGLADGDVSDAQAGAFAMAVCLRGMDEGETVALTLAMRDSGTRFDWHDLPGPVIDKHSTGGIGDKTSLILAPLLAACGAFVPMLSGRGLGHTGGTLDKLESLPGYRLTPDEATLRIVLREAGCAIVGADARVAPADKRLYAVRDQTETVDCLPLIVASILSKKFAGGAGGLVLDVKAGSGAFMPDEAAARRLAEALVRVAIGAGLPTVALLTRMEGTLGRSVGNALEVAEALSMLRGEPADPPLRTVVLALAEAMLDLAGLSGDVARHLADGRAHERFERMVAGLGGTMRLPAPAPIVRAMPAPRAGVVRAVNGRTLGEAVIALGGGRTREGAAIDHAVGLDRVAAPGETVHAGDPLCLIHARDEAGADRASSRLAAAFTIADEAAPGPLIIDRIGSRVA